MRKLCLFGFRLVALLCCLVAPLFAVYDSLNKDEWQHLTTFIANFAFFQQKVSAMPEAPQRWVEFDETCHCPSFKKLSKRDDQLSSKDTPTSLWTASQWLENMFYRNIGQWTSSYTRSDLPSVAESTTVATASRSDIHDVIDNDDTLATSTVTGTGQTGSPLAEVEEETDIFLKTVAKTLWGLLCALDNVVI